MNRRLACKALAGAVAAIGAPGCAPHADGARRRPAALLVGGASAMLPLTTALAQAFMRTRPGLAVVVERGGSLPALIAASRGAIDVAAMTRALSDSEDSAGAHQYLLARGQVDIVVHRDLALASLARQQVQALLTGQVADWQSVGGPQRHVTVYVHPRGAAERLSAEQVVLEGGDFSVEARECADDTALLAAVAADPGAIACIHGSSHEPGPGAGDRLVAIGIDGVAASPATVLTARYPFTYSFYLLLHGAPGGARDAFLQFARSPAGQAIVASQRLVGMC